MQTGQLILLLLLVLVVAVVVFLLVRRSAARKEQQRVEAAALRTDADEIAARLGLLVTGGSDCHGPHPARRHIGSEAVTSEQLDRLRRHAGGAR